MGISETILAAMIGALATMTTALFQLFNAFKSRGKVDVRPKRGSTLKSILSVLALMIASAAGGFLYSEFLKQRKGEDLRAMRQEMREMKDELKSMTAATHRVRDEAVADENVDSPLGAVDAAFARDVASAVTPTGQANNAESVVYVPACRRSAPASEGAAALTCEAADAQRIALCGTIPAYAKVQAIELFAQPDAVQQPWESHRVSLEQDLGGARFTGRSFEYAQGEDVKAVCVNFVHWSSDHPHIARIVVRYGYGDASAPDAQAVGASTVAAAEGGPALPHTALAPPTLAQ
jgi:hypothetical protein